MKGLVNNTAYAVKDEVAVSVDGDEMLLIHVKASFTWERNGDARLAESQPDLVESDQYCGDPAESGLLVAMETGMPRPRVDVLLAGELELPSPVERVDCALIVGSAVQKSVRVHGSRHWTAGMLHDVVPSRARPVDRVRIDWALSYGGTDPGDSSVREPRNPVGTGIRKRPLELFGLPAPSFEDPSQPIDRAGARVEPIGFGPIAPHWEPRVSYAGTYDAAWQQDRHPLPPADFDPRWFNAAPDDQQMDVYRAGAEVRLVNTTRNMVDVFRLPELDAPILIVDDGAQSAAECRVDTVVIRPAERLFSVIARVCHRPRATVEDVTTVIVGTPTAGQLRAIESGKTYVGRARHDA